MAHGEMGTHGRVGLDREILVLGAVIVLGTIMTVLDVTIVNVAVPTLGAEYGTSISTIQWVLTGYMLAFASVIPLSGWASERFGAKRVWIASLLVFMLGSALAAAAWSVGSLIGFRILQGLQPSLEPLEPCRIVWIVLRHVFVLPLLPPAPQRGSGGEDLAGDQL